MLELDVFEPVHPPHNIAEERHFYISKLVKNWESPIQQALARLAERLWPARRLLGFLPLKSYRLRSLEIDPVTYVWWVEHDLEAGGRPGYCQAYGVKLALGALGQPVVTVQSGDTTYPVASFTAEALEATLAQAGCDAPLIIRRSGQ